ncbi:4Fe-4S binding protein [Azospirillum canadense]|uniref:4Fe-4S binding protein n=1 Tax=Azospirillum canadense TaxID=403962 RepID=UPI0022263D1E|nr:4Fe-4S binding protein [Azospirillum canadense]MCW2243265.1 transcriptional regulator of nitric oxide reductase [Azospirillum canadense]
MNTAAFILRALLRCVPALLVLCGGWTAAPAAEGGLTESLARQLVPPGMELGPRDRDIPAYPLVKAGRTVGYVFDSLDYAPLPGFSGTPIELLIAIDSGGGILDVQLVHQNEPVFVDGLGPEPFVEFLKQYRGKSIRQNIKVGSAYGAGEKGTGTNVTIDGVTKATASVRIANVTILSSALAVARARMAGVAPAQGAEVRMDVRHPLPWPDMLAAGHVGRIALRNRDVDRAFAGSRLAHDDPEAAADPDGPFIDLRFALADVPSVGLGLLGEAGYRRFMDKLAPGDHAVAVLADGRWSMMGENFIPGTVPDRLALTQGGFPVNIRDMDLDLPLAPGVPHPAEMKILRIDGGSGFDPGTPWTLSLRVTRTHGFFYPETESRDFRADYTLPADLFTRRSTDNEPDWLPTWRSRAAEIVLLGGLLAVLTAALLTQARITRRPRLFAAGRLLALAVTLGFVGWYAQGQLSIVTLLGVVKAAGTGFDLSFLLYDPISLILWVFALGTLVVWGRGTFCGWLCPFGALQEFAALAGRRLGLPQLRLPPRWDRALTGIKYGVLVMLVGGTLRNAALAEVLAEVEPFKTTITLGFQREWPFVAYAAALLLAGMVLFKPYCRFLCPLGAGLALGGLLRRWNWIPRRTECGTPCRLCERRCRYEAIRRDGSVVYSNCFQCLDCVAIHQDRSTCVPLVLQARKEGKVDVR